ncbi:hypothetical protein, partial [uncultured Parabacteroides sp.]|uniref:hypothetical protein n=1 Tax=uncultured Parabacteroides sp. TaxID=512312 RepID=UPI0025D3BB58
VQRFSRPPQSTTLPSLLVFKTGAKVVGSFQLCKFFTPFLLAFFTLHFFTLDYQINKIAPILKKIPSLCGLAQKLDSI